MNWEQRDQLSFGDRAIHAANMGAELSLQLQCPGAQAPICRAHVSVLRGDTYKPHTSKSTRGRGQKTKQKKHWFEKMLMPSSQRCVEKPVL